MDEGVKIILDKERTLRFTLGALRAFEKVSQTNVIQLDWKNISATDTSYLLWCALLHEDKTLTVEQVENMVDKTNLVEVMERLIEAWIMSVPKKRGESVETPLAK